MKTQGKDARRPDVLVIGAGVFGLWVARACLDEGLRVAVIEAGPAPGAGASGGPVGALAPHRPGRASPLRTLQLDALDALPGEIAMLEDETGRATGYARRGRLAPLATEADRIRALTETAAAPNAWGGRGRAWLLEPAAAAEAGLDPAACPSGAFADDLTAQIVPTAYLAALAAAVGARAPIDWGTVCHRVAPGQADCADGIRSAGAIVVAAGAATGPLLGFPVRGVKGQAATLDAHLPAGPLITAPGLYVVAHAAGHVAVGSTSEPDWTEPEPDRALDDVVERARALVPRLAGARVASRWAGLRPRAPRPQPLVGAVPGQPGLWLATGGFKIGLALAHQTARALARQIIDPSASAVPPELAPSAHAIGSARPGLAADGR